MEEVRNKMNLSLKHVQPRLMIPHYKSIFRQGSKTHRMEESMEKGSRGSNVERRRYGSMTVY